MTNFFQDNNKLDRLINNLLKVENKGQEFELIIVSCYLNLESLEGLINKFIDNEEIKNKVNLSEVNIYTNRAEGLKIGKENLEKWREENQHININFYFYNKYNLFHPKAYCLIDKERKNGSLVIGSANLTERGITDTNGNIELLYDIQEIEKIRHFKRQLENLNYFIKIDELEKFTKEDLYFKYFLITQGCVIETQNNETINSKLKIYFDFNERGKKEYVSEDYKKTQSENDAKTHYRNYFQNKVKDIENILNEFCPKSLIPWGLYAINIDTNIFSVKWIPKIAIDGNIYTGELISNNQQKIQKCIEKIKNDILNVETLKIAEEELNKNWEIFRKNDWLINPDQKPNLTEHINNFLEFDNFTKLIKDRYKIYELDNFSLNKPEEINDIYNQIKKGCLKILKIKSIEKKIDKIQESDAKIAKYILLVIHDLSFEHLNNINVE